MIQWWRETNQMHLIAPIIKKSIPHLGESLTGIPVYVSIAIFSANFQSSFELKTD